MKFHTMVVAAAVVALTGCASSTRPSTERHPICFEIADFAIASTDGLVRQVTLINDWGGVECNSDKEGEIAIACKTCSHDSYGPGKHLCGYLMENTSTEFPRLNFTRVLGCLDNRFQRLVPGHRADRMADRQIWSSHAKLVERGIAVGVKYLSGNEKELPVLIISAQRRRAS